MKHVVSVSLGSSQRNRTLDMDFGGESFRLERIGTDGNVHLAEELIAQRDGKVDAIGLGGVDRYLYAGGKKYELRDAARMARAATQTPVVDGGGIKLMLEPVFLRQLVNAGLLDVTAKRVMLVSAVDRPGMAETFPALGAKVAYGDLIFAVGVPVAMTSLKQVAVVGAVFLPILRRLPMSVLYPTGGSQDSTKEKHSRYFAWADILAGDFQYIRRYMTDDMAGKIVVTNTTRSGDIEELKKRGVSKLITMTPTICGESFGANVMEAVLVALSGKQPDELTEGDYLTLADQMGWSPGVTEFENENK